MRNRKLTFTNVGVIKGSRVWRNQETGVEIIKGKNFAEVGLYYVCVPTRDAAGRIVVTTCTTLATARKMAAIRAEQWRIRIRQAHTDACLEDSDREGERLTRERIAKARDDQRAGSVNPAADPAWVAARDAAGEMTDAEADAYYTALERQRTTHYRSPELGYQACGEMYSSDGLTEVRSEVTCQPCRDRYNSDYWKQATAGMPRVPAFIEGE